MEEDESDRNGINIVSPIDSSLAVYGGVEIKPFVDKSYNLETNQMTIKSEPCQDAKCAENQPKSIMGYHESERCLAIKSEYLDIKKEEDEYDW
ncbi:hypothetical protein NQ318_008515 [Aromia moschata]|uniref:Uncharacterized protein n=1 Tax=Aromia moschata TaxID=1265417 RepID=A0AAV8XDC9_9CUCU|nr:hypothetical protein NQ318_008515 [Aromia moschata]